MLMLPSRNLSEATVIAIALTSTALGTLLPILREGKETGTPLGKSVLTHGAVGELGPVIAMALLLTSREPLVSIAVLGVFAAVAVLAAVTPRTLIASAPFIHRLMRTGAHATTQTTIRGVFFLLTALMAVAIMFDLDVVLGAFAAGIILRRIGVEDDLFLEPKLDAIAYGIFVPVFFVDTGMHIYVSVVTERPLQIAGIVGLIALVRGVPVFLSEKFFPTGSGLVSFRSQVRLGLYAATGLPIIVAVTKIAEASDLINHTSSSMLVMAGAFTVLLFPPTAKLLRERDPRKRSL
ncbi:MAG: potassium transporter Kef [Propionibacterium sp.]|nr:MAG: potassium transporter Kef [Propionibacterium sp.]